MNSATIYHMVNGLWTINFFCCSLMTHERLMAHDIFNKYLIKTEFISLNLTLIQAIEIEGSL